VIRLELLRVITPNYNSGSGSFESKADYFDISRVTTQKYMLTPHGMFELKYFFGSHVATEAGGEASSTAIRALIVQLTGAEDPKNPLSDSKIAEMLGEQGMVIARRTVAKYREALKIPPVSLRKSL
jgi:RNA polymerase sigma-54 factor